MFYSNSFADLMKLLDQKILNSAIKTNNSDKGSQKLNTKTHLMAVIFAQITNPHGLREMELQLDHMQKIMCKYGMNKVKKSTLSDANRNRDSKVFADIAKGLINKSKAIYGDLIDCVSLLDSSTITIKGRGTGWTEDTRIRTGQGLKLHVEYLSCEDIINSIKIGPTNINDVTAATDLKIQEGWTYVYDKGYNDYNWWYRIHTQGAFFVTRIKKNAKIKVTGERKVDKKSNPYIISDSYVLFSNKNPRGGKINQLADTTLRLIVAINPEDNKEYSFITNNLSESSSVIATYYKTRWQIELLFKWLKQILKIKKFLCQNENGIKSQIYAAIITYILIGIYKRLSGEGASRSLDILSKIKIHLFYGAHQSTSGYYRKKPNDIRNANLCLDL